MSDTSKNEVIFKSGYPFVAFPAWIFAKQMENPDWLSCKEITLILALQSFADGMQGDKTVYPSVERLAKMTALSKRTVIDTIKDLQEKGLIEKETRYKNGERKTNIYTLKIWNHAEPVQEAGVSGSSQGHLTLSANPALTPDPKCRNRQSLSADPAPKLEPLNNNHINPPISPLTQSRPEEPQPPASQARSQTPPGASVRRSEQLQLPAYAEPVRTALEAWLAQSRKKHRSSKRQLSPSDLRGIKAAHELGVLAEYAELASESTWMSLGFSGHVDLLQKLQRDAKFHGGAVKKEIKEISDEAFL